MSLANNLENIRTTLAEACAEAGREVSEITLTAVSKTVPVNVLEEALGLGLRVFGENRVQEAQSKWPCLKARFPNIQLRLIGPLQTNKAKEALELFEVIETLDREKLAAALAKEIEKGAPSVPMLVQVNTGEEPQKAGIAPREALAFIELCRSKYGLNVCGVMGIPPAQEPPAPHFALLAKIARAARLPIISMGMSSDYPIAAQLGATHIRVGSALFGAR